MIIIIYGLMNLLNKILFISGLIFLITLHTPAQTCKANVTIQCNLDSALIFLNSGIIGKGSARIELNKGEYPLEIVRDTVNWGSETINDTIKITECRPYKFSYHFTKSFYMQSNPQDAGVYKGDSLLGYTPLFLPLNIGDLRLEKPDYAAKSINQREFNKNEIINLQFNGKVPEKSFYERDIFKILVGSIVVLGGTTAYFKLKADNYFEQYQNTGETKFLNQTRTNDLISGITMGALQINFGILIYYFLTD